MRPPDEHRAPGASPHPAGADPGPGGPPRRDEPRNRVLGALPPDEYALLLMRLEPCAINTLDVLADAERSLRHVYFPETALISVLRRMRDGTLIEAYAVGRDGMVGVPHLLGDPGSPAGTILGEVPGSSLRMPLEELRGMLPELPALAALLPRLALALLDEVQQAVACNSLHTVEQRCARWLLMTHDRVGIDEFLLTHDVLSQMLAVRRAGVTVAAGVLQRAGIITYSRGHVRVVDRAGLEAAACECYGMVRAHGARLLGHTQSPSG